MVLPPTFLYHAITREEEKGGGSGYFSPGASLYTNSNKALAAFIFFFRLLFPRALGWQDFHIIQEQLLQQTRKGFRDAMWT